MVETKNVLFWVDYCDTRHYLEWKDGAGNYGTEEEEEESFFASLYAYFAIVEKENPFLEYYNGDGTSVCYSIPMSATNDLCIDLVNCEINFSEQREC